MVFVFCFMTCWFIKLQRSILSSQFISIYKFSSMSIKDRIKFFENLNKQEQVNPLPNAPVNKLFQNKKQTPNQVAHQTEQPNQKKIELKREQQIPKKLQSTQPPKITLPKSVQTMNHCQPQRLSPQTSQTSNKKFQNEEPSTDQTIINVKNLRQKFEKKEFPILHQQPVGMASCFVPRMKSPFEEKTQPASQKPEPSKPQERRSLPEKTEDENGEKKLTFQQMRKIAQITLNKTKIGLLSKHHEPEENTLTTQQTEDTHPPGLNQENAQHGAHIIKAEIKQKAERIGEQPQDHSSRNQNDESDKLFNEALKQQEEKQGLLVTGQSNALNLATRKTMTKKRNIDDDFDDL